MEVEQVLPITSSKLEHITNGDNSIVIPSSISVEEKDHVNGAAAETNDADMISTAMNKSDGDDDKTRMVSEPAAIAITRTASSNGLRQQSKKRGAFGLFRAIFMSFSSSASMKKRDAAAAAFGDKKKANVACSSEKTAVAATAAVARSASDVASWKNLVDGMRPLRLYGQLEYYPPPPPMGHDVYHDVILPPPSPERGFEGMMTSRYSSAQDLQVLVNGHEKDDDEEETAPATEDGGCRPNAIDMQAEEFIAKFYEQFRLQKSDSFNNRID